MIEIISHYRFTSKIYNYYLRIMKSDHILNNYRLLYFSTLADLRIKMEDFE